MKHANREPNSYNHLGAFYLTCFVRVCETFTVVVSELQRCLTLCFNVFMPPHILYKCSVLFLNTDKKTDLILIKTVRHVFCQIFQLWRFRLVCLCS